MGPRASISSGRPSSIKSKTSSTISNGEDIMNSLAAHRQLNNPLDSTTGKIQRGTEQRKSGKSVTITLNEGESEMSKSIIQERPLPELPITRYDFIGATFFVYPILTVDIFIYLSTPFDFFGIYILFIFSSRVNIHCII